MMDDGILWLRALEPTDLDTLYRWENDSSLWDVGCSIAPFSRKQLWDYIENYDADIFNARQLRLIVEEKATGKAVGTIDMYDFDPVHRRAWVGVLIDSAVSHRGYGTRSLELLARYASDRLGVHQLMAVVPEGNEWSCRLFEKCGYHRSGILIDWLRAGSVYRDAVIFQLILE